MRCHRAQIQTFGTAFLVFYVFTVIIMLSYLRYENQQQQFWFREQYDWSSGNKTRDTKIHRRPLPLQPWETSSKKQPPKSTPFDKEFPNRADPIVDGSFPNCSHDIDQASMPVFKQLTKEIYFLSAFYDTRKPDETYIRVLALLTEAASRKTFYCYVEDTHQDIYPVKAIKYVFNENHARYYGGWIISCPVQRLINVNMCVVFMSLHPDLNLYDFPDQYIKLDLIPTGPVDTENKEHQFSVCVPPLFGNIKLKRLVEFIEVTRLLGAEMFYFYPYMGEVNKDSHNEDLKQLLSYYQEKDIVKIYPWTLPIAENLIWYYGQMLSIHHCMFTNMRRSRYIIFNDIDEFLVPVKKKTWPDMMRILDNNKHSGWRFKSILFSPEPTHDLVTVHSLYRTATANKIRTKCMIRPDRMFEMGIHHISKWNEEVWTPVEASENIAVLHHYRSCDSTFTLDCNSLVRDAKMLRYKERLLTNYNITIDDVRQKKMLLL